MSELTSSVDSRGATSSDDNAEAYFRHQRPIPGRTTATTHAMGNRR
jgi:hypothetical protein